MIFVLGFIPTVLLFALARFETKGVGPSPMKIMGWTWLFGYTIKSIYLSYAVEHHLPFRPDWIALYVIDNGQLAILLGVMTMAIGYVSTTLTLDRFNNITPVPNPLSVDIRIIYYPLLALSLVLLGLFFRQMGFIDQILNLRFVATKFFVSESGERSALGFLSIGGDFLVVFFIYYIVMARKLTWINIYTLSMALLAVSLFLSSRRNGILAIIILLMIVYAVRKMNANVLARLLRVGAVVLILVGVSFSSQIRNSAGDGQTLGQLDVMVALQATATHALEGAYFIDPAKTAAIIETMESREDFFWGASFLGFVIAPIPRVLWPEKPSVRMGPYVAQELFSFGSAAGVPPGAIGEFYINFGWPGIAAGMALLGAFLAFIWWRHRRAEDPRFTIIRYAFLMLSVIYFITVEFTAAIVIFAKYYIVIIVAERYWRAKLAREGRLAPSTALASSDDGLTYDPLTALAPAQAPR